MERHHLRVNRVRKALLLYKYKKKFYIKLIIMYYKNICIICGNIFYHAEKHIDICFECIKLIQEYMKNKFVAQL